MNASLLTQYLTARLKRAGRRCTVQVALSKRGVRLRLPLHLGKGHDHIRAGQLVKHLSGLRSGTGDCPSASQRRFQLSRFDMDNLWQMAQVGKLCEEIQLMRHRLCVSLSCD